MEVTRALLPSLLEELFTESSIRVLQAKLNYELLMARVGLTSAFRNAASAVAPTKSSLKRKGTVDFDERDDSPGRSSSSPAPRASSLTPKVQKPLGQSKGLRH